MRQKILNKNKIDPFAVIRSLPEQPLFKDCPVKPTEETIEAAEELYLKFAYDPPTYVSSNNEQVILEWNYYKKVSRYNEKLVYSKELIIKDPINLEWKEFRYEQEQDS